MADNALAHVLQPRKVGQADTWVQEERQLRRMQHMQSHAVLHLALRSFLGVSETKHAARLSRTHRILPWLKAGATAFLTSFQCSSVGPVSKLVPPKNCTCICQLTASIEVLLLRLGIKADQQLLHHSALCKSKEQKHGKHHSVCSHQRLHRCSTGTAHEHLCNAVKCAQSAQLRWQRVLLQYTT